MNFKKQKRLIIAEIVKVEIFDQSSSYQSFEYKKEPSQVFAGLWGLKYINKVDNQVGTENFIVKDDNLYYFENEPKAKFKFLDFEINLIDNTLKFTKMGLNANDKRILVNNLIIIDDLNFVGTEYSNDGQTYDMIYTRLK